MRAQLSPHRGPRSQAGQAVLRARTAGQRAGGTEQGPQTARTPRLWVHGWAWVVGKQRPGALQRFQMSHKVRSPGSDQNIKDYWGSQQPTCVTSVTPGLHRNRQVWSQQKFSEHTEPKMTRMLAQQTEGDPADMCQELRSTVSTSEGPEPQPHAGSAAGAI